MPKSFMSRLKRRGDNPKPLENGEKMSVPFRNSFPQFVCPFSVLSRPSPSSLPFSRFPFSDSRASPDNSGSDSFENNPPGLAGPLHEGLAFVPSLQNYKPIGG